MIWSLFSKHIDSETLITELKSEDPKISGNAYKELINQQDDFCDNLLINELSLPITPKKTKIDIIKILGLRATDKAVPSFQKLLKTSDKDFLLAIYEALYNICTPDSIDELVMHLTVIDDDLRKTIASYILKLPTE